MVSRKQQENAIVEFINILRIMTELKFYLSPISISFSGIGHSDSSLCVNDFIYTRNNDELFENLGHMISQFDMKFLGDLDYFLGIEV